MINIHKSWLSIGLMALGSLVCADEYRPEALDRVDQSLHLQKGSAQVEAQKINDVIYKATGFGNTFMVLTDEGNVIIDTSIKSMAKKHKNLLTAVNDGPIHSIILTHAHPDHTGGVELWREADTKVIAQENMVEFQHYQKRLEGVFDRRNRAQFGFDLSSDLEPVTKVENFAAKILPNTLFDEALNFSLGGQEFQLLHTPAETYDALTVWMPQHKAAFVGDLFYKSFPNIYTLRGTKPRWALDYVASLDKVLALEPELLMPSHGEPIVGRDNIRASLTQYRDAILYVHDQTVLGLNQGKDVHDMMRDIKLPANLEVGEAYGWVSWSVRGIYEGYMGWFDGDPASMYPLSSNAVYADLVSLAGGVDKVIDLARRLIAEDNAIKALHLVDAALEVEPEYRLALELRLQVLESLRRQSSNLNESGWLNHGIAQTKQKLAVRVTRN